MAKIYLESADTNVTIGGASSLLALPGQAYTAVRVVLIGAAATVDLSTLSAATAAKTTIVLTKASTAYTYAPNAATGMVSVMDGATAVATLPVGSDLMTTAVEYTNGSAHVTVNSVGTTASIGTLTPAGNTWTATAGNTGVATLAGVVGQRDTFVFHYKSDAVGAVGDFGQYTVNNYTRADGDIVSFVNDNSALPWTAIGSFITGGTIAANGGSSRINFTDDPNIHGIAEQYIVLTGVTQTTTMGATLADVNAEFTFA
jgi:hypothetical protein